MSVYTPDKWVLVKFRNGEFYKVFASWLGGYIVSGSWRLNSGITSIEEKDNFYLIHGNSGSIYECRKGSYGVTSVMSRVLKEMIEEENKNGTIMEIVSDIPEDLLTMEWEK